MAFLLRRDLDVLGQTPHFYSAGRMQMRPGTTGTSSLYTQLIHCANSTPETVSGRLKNVTSHMIQSALVVLNNLSMPTTEFLFIYMEGINIDGFEL